MRLWNMARLRRESLSTKDSGGEPCDMKDRECKVEDVDKSAVVHFAGTGIGLPVIM